MIGNVWSLGYIRKATERNPSHYVSPENRKLDLWLNAREKMEETILALVAWAEAGGRSFGGPDASDLQKLVAEVTSDSDMHVESLIEYEGVRKDAVALGKMLRGALNKELPAELIRGYLDDCTRFDRDAKDAYFNYVIE